MISFGLAVFLLIITPGPGVLSTAGVELFWLHRGLFYIAGLCLGTNIGGLAVISGVAAIILAELLIRIVLLFVSAVWDTSHPDRTSGDKIAFIRSTGPGS